MEEKVLPQDRGPASGTTEGPGRPIEFACPHCAMRLEVPATMAGVRGPCPGCGEGIEAPAKPAPRAIAIRPRLRPRRKKPESAPAQPPAGQLMVLPPGYVPALGTPPPGVAMAPAAVAPSGAGPVQPVYHSGSSVAYAPAPNVGAPVHVPPHGAVPGQVPGSVGGAMVASPTAPVPMPGSGQVAAPGQFAVVGQGEGAMQAPGPSPFEAAESGSGQAVRSRPKSRPGRAVNPVTGISERYQDRKDVVAITKIIVAVLITIGIVLVVAKITKKGMSRPNHPPPQEAPIEPQETVEKP